MILQGLTSAALDIALQVAFNQTRGHSVSTDGKCFWDEFYDAQTKLEILARRIAGGRFEFAPFKRIVRKMKSGKERAIFLPTWRDRIVDRWLSVELSRVWLPRFSRHSYAFREDVGIDQCCREISAAVRRNDYFLKRDISQYYYTIDKELLLQKVSAAPLDPLVAALVGQRVRFSFVEEGATEIQRSDLGIAFGSSLSCVLANVFLTDLDHLMTRPGLTYFRYADDFLLCTQSREEAVQAAALFDGQLAALKLATKPSHSLNLTFREGDDFFQHVERVGHLGLVFTKTDVSLHNVKFRKILSMFRRELRLQKRAIGKTADREARLRVVIGILNATVSDRVRGVAIIDYYLKHVTDERQLVQLDRWLAETAISQTLDRPFRKGHFRRIPFQKLRDLGLVSLLHRGRLLRHGKIRTRFREMLNANRLARGEAQRERKLQRIEALQMLRAIKRQEEAEDTQGEAK